MEKRVRSPNYPALSLPEAVDKVAMIYRANHTHAAPREVIAKAMGYAGLNGASATAISALHKYGLLEKVGAEEIRVSERAMQILHPNSAAEKAEAVRSAAGAPPLFAELAERFPGKMPNDDIFRNYLIRKGFAPAALTAVISAYRETSDMVERGAGGYDDAIEQSSEAIMNQQLQPQPSKIQHGQISYVSQLDERQIGSYNFEGGASLRIVVSGEIDTEEALDMAQTVIDLKRKEIERRNKYNNAPPPVLIRSPENDERI